MPHFKSHLTAREPRTWNRRLWHIYQVTLLVPLFCCILVFWQDLPLCVWHIGSHSCYCYSINTLNCRWVFLNSYSFFSLHDSSTRFSILLWCCFNATLPIGIKVMRSHYKSQKGFKDTILPHLFGSLPWHMVSMTLGVCWMTPAMLSSTNCQ